MRRTARILAMILLPATMLGGSHSARAYLAGNSPFHATWARTDLPVVAGAVARTWMWGPQANTGLLTEEYTDSPSGVRQVQYFDKSRMEINDPGNPDKENPWYVTNGLLVVEMASGYAQTGDITDEFHGPADTVNVIGDPDDPNAPTYATVQSLRGLPARDDGALIQDLILDDGSIVSSPAHGVYDVRSANRVQVPGIDHQVASVFWDFMNSSGIVYEEGGYTTGVLFINPFYATGYPITEAYWANVKVAGTVTSVLFQCFERRCLTYTPRNDPAWQVEAGNVGQHYYRWRYGSDPPAPSSSRQLAFTSERDGDAEIYLVNDDGTGLLNLTNNPARDYNAAWSPDGRQIAFVSDRGGVADIWVMDADGGNPHNLTPQSGDEYAPAWSPDGRSIAFTSVRDGNYEIYVMDADGGNQRNLTNHPRGDYSPVWSPDSREVAFTSDRVDIVGRFAGVFVVGLDGSERRIAACREHNSNIAWSPDGTHIAFLSRTYTGASPDICVATADGNDAYPLFDFSQLVMSGPTWSPDSVHIAGSWRNIYGEFGDDTREIFVSDLDGNAQTISNQADRDPVWSPDGERLAWVSGRYDGDDITVDDPDGHSQHVVAQYPAIDSDPAWRP